MKKYVILNALMIIACGRIDPMDLSTVSLPLIGTPKTDVTNAKLELFKNTLNGNTGEVIDLLQSGVDPNRVIPLHVAAFLGNSKLVAALIDYNAQVNAQGKDGVTPLCAAIIGNHPSVVHQLLDVGANPRLSLKELFNCTPLHLAAFFGNEVIIRSLLGKKVPVDATTDPGKLTPLHIASALGHLETIKELVKANASFYIKDSHGRVPIDLSRTEEIRGYLLPKIIRQPTQIQ